MGGTNNTKIFISYARKDGANLARRLQNSLADEGFDPWLDKQRLVGGATWTTDIEQAIDKSQVLLALVSPGSYVSEICRAEQLRSLRKGKRVIPLLAVAGSDIPLHLEAEQYRDFTGSKPYPSQFKVLLEDIRGGAGVALKEEYRATRVTYVTAPSTVVNYIDRPQALAVLRDALFAEHNRGPLALTALAGMGGIGKTVLANALTRDRVVQDAFPDGIVWITIGREQTSDLLTAFREVGKALGDDFECYDSLPAAINQYKTALAQKAVLIVVDDIWKKSDLEPFLADSERSRLLFTTRYADVASFIGASEHTADLLGLDQARELLAAWADLDGNPRPAQFDAVIKECGKLPLALSIVGAMLRGATPEEWDDALNLLRKADLSGIADRLPPGQESFFRAVEVSFKALAPEMQERYKALAVLLEDMAAPLPILQTLWGVSEPEARRISRHFVDRSLAQRGSDGSNSIRLRQPVILAEAGIQPASDRDSIHLHDLQLDYVRAQHPDREALDLIHGAVRLSSHVIECDPKQFASQMLGRLLPHQQIAPLRQFTDAVIKGALRPWLRPLWPTLHPPGTALVRTLTGHRGGVNAVALTADGRAVSASGDQTLKLWDLKAGRALVTLEGHSNPVSGVAVASDGKRAVSASWDKTLKVWDLEAGRELRTLSGHSDWVRGVAVSGDGRLAVSASADQTLKVWDLEAGSELRTLTGHSDQVLGVAVSGDGRRAVSACSRQRLKVWDLETGLELHTLCDHYDHVTGIAVSRDGGLAVSASADRTLKVWDLEAGRELRTLTGHSESVNGVALSGDRAVSASDDQTLKVWDLETGNVIATFTCDAAARCCAFAGDRRIVAGDEAARVHFLQLEL
jgi:WD40 repeat protein